MPIYEYVCSYCNGRFEKFSKFSSGETDTRCPDCKGTEVRKVFSTFATSVPRLMGDSSPYSPAATGGVGYSPAGPA